MASKNRYHHPDLRQALLDGALKLIQEEGLRGFSLRKLAAKAGVSHAAPYRHFENKDEILFALMLEGHKRLRKALVDAEQSCNGTAADKYLAMTRAYLAFARQNPEHLRVMFSREAMAAAMGREHAKFHDNHDSWGALEGLVRRCQDEGFLPREADPGVLSLLAWAEVHGLALLCNEGAIETMSVVRAGAGDNVLEEIFAVMKSRLSRSKKSAARTR